MGRTFLTHFTARPSRFLQPVSVIGVVGRSGAKKALLLNSFNTSSQGEPQQLCTMHLTGCR